MYYDFVTCLVLSIPRRCLLKTMPLVHPVWVGFVPLDGCFRPIFCYTSTCPPNIFTMPFKSHFSDLRRNIREYKGHRYRDSPETKDSVYLCCLVRRAICQKLCLGFSRRLWARISEQTWTFLAHRSPCHLVSSSQAICWRVGLIGKLSFGGAASPLVQMMLRYAVCDCS